VDFSLLKCRLILRGLWLGGAVLAAGPIAFGNDFAKNEEVRSELRRQGDDCRTARPIEHFAYFPTSAAMMKYRQFVLGRAYSIDHENEEPKVSKRWRLAFSKIQIPDNIDDETEALGTNADQFGGEYDGWETEVVHGS
jgi:hypothetical protein